MIMEMAYSRLADSVVVPPYPEEASLINLTTVRAVQRAV
jgi:hypothetical protein